MKYILQWTAIIIIGLLIAASTFLLVIIWFLINVMCLLWDFTFYNLELEEFMEIIADWVETQIIARDITDDIRGVLIIFSGIGGLCSTLIMIKSREPLYGILLALCILSMIYNLLKIKKYDTDDIGPG